MSQVWRVLTHPRWSLGHPGLYCMLHVPSLKCPYTSQDVLTHPRWSLGHPELYCMLKFEVSLHVPGCSYTSQEALRTSKVNVCCMYQVWSVLTRPGMLLQTLGHQELLYAECPKSEVSLHVPGCSYRSQEVLRTSRVIACCISQVWSVLIHYKMYICHSNVHLL